MTKTLTVTTDDVNASIEKHAKAMAPAGLTASAGALPDEAKGLLGKGICGILEQVRPMIKKALNAEGFIGHLAFGVLDDLVFKKLCPDIGGKDASASAETVQKKG